MECLRRSPEKRRLFGWHWVPLRYAYAITCEVGDVGEVGEVGDEGDEGENYYW